MLGVHLPLPAPITTLHFLYKHPASPVIAWLAYACWRVPGLLTLAESLLLCNFSVIRNSAGTLVFLSLPFQFYFFKHTGSFSILQTYQKPESVRAYENDKDKSKSYISVTFINIWLSRYEPLFQWGKVPHFSLKVLIKSFICHFCPCRAQNLLLSQHGPLGDEFSWSGMEADPCSWSDGKRTYCSGHVLMAPSGNWPSYSRSLGYKNLPGTLALISWCFKGK